MFSAEPRKTDAPLEADDASRSVSQHPVWTGGGLRRTPAGAGFDPDRSVRNVSVLTCTNQCSQWATNHSWGSSLQPDSLSRRLFTLVFAAACTGWLKTEMYFLNKYRTVQYIYLNTRGDGGRGVSHWWGCASLEPVPHYFKYMDFICLNGSWQACVCECAAAVHQSRTVYRLQEWNWG